MDKRAGPVAEISLERGEISLTGMENSPYKHSQAGQPGWRDDIFNSVHASNPCVHVKMAELHKIRERSTGGKKANKVEKKAQRKNFRWETDMIEHLIDCLLDYKSSMMYKNLDFDADKPMQYRKLRLAMATIYEEDISVFGPLALTPLPSNFEQLSKEDKAKAKLLQKKSKELIDKGIKQIMEKVKEIRQNFAKAVVAGNRSGSGKIVYEFYEKLILIWGGSANTKSLPYGVTADDLLEESSAEDDSNFSNYDEIDREILLAEENEKENDQEDDFEKEGMEESTSTSEVVPSKRKGNCVPQLIDNKRKHLERNLSAAQRDQLLIKEAKEDSKFKKDLADVNHPTSLLKVSKLLVSR